MHDRAPADGALGVFELHIDSIGCDSVLTRVRWELFACPEIRHVFRIGTTDRALIVYAGHEPAPQRWAAAANAARLTRAAGDPPPSDPTQQPLRARL